MALGLHGRFLGNGREKVGRQNWPVTNERNLREIMEYAFSLHQNLGNDVIQRSLSTRVDERFDSGLCVTLIDKRILL